MDLSNLQSSQIWHEDILLWRKARIELMSSPFGIPL